MSESERRYMRSVLSHTVLGQAYNPNELKRLLRERVREGFGAWPLYDQEWEDGVGYHFEVSDYPMKPRDYNQLGSTVADVPHWSGA